MNVSMHMGHSDSFSFNVFEILSFFSKSLYSGIAAFTLIGFSLVFIDFIESSNRKSE